MSKQKRDWKQRLQLSKVAKSTTWELMGREIESDRGKGDSF
jgi:hypothetical protein